MSDLISRSALIEILEDYENDNWNKNISAMLPSVVDDCIDFIENMPTAYDIGKVVAELYKELEVGNIAIDYGEFRLFEIVKQGGVGTESEMIRENANGYSKEDIELNRKAMYNKAIDDLTNMILTEIKNGVGGNIEDFIKEIAEQLKAGDNNADSN